MLLAVLCLVPTAAANAVQAKNKTEIQHKAYYYDSVARLAFSLGVSSKQLTLDEAKILFSYINSSSEESLSHLLPDVLAHKWQSLLHAAQLLSSISANQYYFPVGIEIESAHSSLQAWKDFSQGAQNIFGNVESIFGNSNLDIVDDKQNSVGHLKDAAGREWSLKLEWAREGEGTLFPSGWELNTPPFKNLDELELFYSLLSIHGKSPFGQTADFSGMHLNLDTLPADASNNPQVRALTIANFMILHEQFYPLITKILQVDRFGGPTNNVFIRPYLFDYHNLLTEISQTEPQQINLQSLQKIFKNNLRQEYEIQAREHIVDPEKRKIADGDWENYRQSWKSRNFRIKWSDDSSKVLIESRILDHKPGSPHNALKGIMIMQLLLSHAYEMAQLGKLSEFTLPARMHNQDLNSYWQQLTSFSEITAEHFFSVLGVKNQAARAALLDEGFATNRNFVAGKKITFGFEVEFFSSDIVEALVPTFPEDRVLWTTMSKEMKIKFLQDLGFDFNNQYSEEKYRILTSRFRLDVDKYPFMNTHPHLEESGRLEVLSNGRGIFELSDLKKKAEVFLNILKKSSSLPTSSASVSFHFHAFIPEKDIARLTPKEISAFVKFLERLSFYMNLVDYEEEGIRHPPHRLDSWSLDRYSQQDLDAVFQHLIGYKKLKNSDQKYHNIGFRPVDGGLDIEVRSAGNDIQYGVEILNMVIGAIKNRDFGDEQLLGSPALFMEPMHYKSELEYDKFTLRSALSKLQPGLSSQDLEILHKLQFEIYKPSMGEYMRLPHDNTIETAPAGDLSTDYLRANFESNISIPLQNWDSMSYLTSTQKATLLTEQKVFLAKIHSILNRIRGDFKYKFILDNKNFYYLCDYLDRSTHHTKPMLLQSKKADMERELLESLVYEIRGAVVKFVKNSRADQMVLTSLKSKKKCSALLKRDI